MRQKGGQRALAWHLASSTPLKHDRLMHDVQGSCGLLIGALYAQPLFAAPPAVTFWLGQVVGYFIGSWWFVTGALAQIADVAQESQATVLRAHPQNTDATIYNTCQS